MRRVGARVHAWRLRARADRRCVAGPRRACLLRRARGTTAAARDAAREPDQPGLHRHREPRHEPLARRRRAAQLGHDRHRGLARRAAPLRRVRPDDRHGHAVLEQCGNLLVPALLREQRVAGGRRPRAGTRVDRRGRAAVLSRPADGRRLLPLRAPRAARRHRRVRPRIRRRLRRGERLLHARRRGGLPQRALRRRLRRARRRPLVRRGEGDARRAQHRAPARAPSGLPRSRPRLHRAGSVRRAARVRTHGARPAARAGARGAARDPRGWRHRSPGAGADRRDARDVAARARDRAGRHLARRGAPERRQHEALRVRAPRRRAARGIPEDAVRELWRRRDPPAQHLGQPRAAAGRDATARHSVRVHGARPQLRLPDGDADARRRVLLRRCHRRGGVHLLPRGAAPGCRRHRTLARPPRGAPRRGLVRDRAVALCGRPAAALLSRDRPGGHRARASRARAALEAAPGRWC